MGRYQVSAALGLYLTESLPLAPRALAPVLWEAQPLCPLWRGL